jgi:hypothetical protein
MKPFPSSPARRGLAPLEMVLALPILLFIMALIVNYGTIASWKVRTLSIARQESFGERWPRTAAASPQPAYWPAAATAMGSAGMANQTALDDPRPDQPVARGPMLGNIVVNRDLLDPSRGFRDGSAQLTRRYPMLGRLGSYQVKADSHLLDDKWQYQRMGIPSTIAPRIPYIYTLKQPPTALIDAYVQAAVAIYFASFRTALAPLDRDPEYITYSRLGLCGGPPDFYPRLRGFCSLERSQVDPLVESLIKRIDGLPKSMAQSFLNFYNSLIRRARAMIARDQRMIAALGRISPQTPEIQAQINALNTQISQLQAAIAAVQPEIPEVTSFLNSLGG